MLLGAMIIHGIQSGPLFISQNAFARAEFGMFDLADAEDVQRMVDAALASFGRVDILVNNAGIRIRQPFGEYSAEDFDKLVAVNLLQGLTFCVVT